MYKRQGEGIQDLLKAIAEVASGAYATRPRRINHRDPQLESVVGQLVRQVEYCLLYTSAWSARRPAVRPDPCRWRRFRCCQARPRDGDRLFYWLSVLKRDFGSLHLYH